MDTPLLIRLAQKNTVPSQLERQACLALAGLGQVISCRRSTWSEQENTIIVDFLADGESFNITLLPKGKGYWEWEILSGGDHGTYVSTYVSLSCAPLIVDKLTGRARVNRLALEDWKRKWDWDTDMDKSLMIYELVSHHCCYYSLQPQPHNDGYWPIIAAPSGWAPTTRVLAVGEPFVSREQVYSCTAALPEVLTVSEYVGGNRHARPIDAIADLLGLPRP